MKNFITNYWDSHSATIITISYNFLLAIVILVATFFIARTLRHTIYHGKGKAARLDATLRPVFAALCTYLVYVVGLVVALDIFGVNTTRFIALLGAAGLAVGLALKDTLANIAAGTMLLILRPFCVGDFVAFGSTMGTVKEINLFTTILGTFDGLYVAAPNGEVWSNTMTNYSRNGTRRLDLVVGISYGDSMDVGLEVLRQIAATEPRFLKEPAPQALVVAMADRSVNLQLRGWATNENYWSTLWDVNK
ncbi:MAG: mechanosensitive ion channel family protein, partial [Deltaproteobacteria bacterium]|nr:mechanosensitive ion channel family protein [Deltaproteobacteria bacterium]